MNQDVLPVGLQRDTHGVAQHAPPASSRTASGKPLLKARHEICAMTDLDRGPFKIRPDRLHTPAQSFSQESFGHGVEGFSVFRPGEAVPLIRVEHVGDGDISGLHRVHDLV